MTSEAWSTEVNFADRRMNQTYLDLPVSIFVPARHDAAPSGGPQRPTLSTKGHRLGKTRRFPWLSGVLLIIMSVITRTSRLAHGGVGLAAALDWCQGACTHKGCMQSEGAQTVFSLSSRVRVSQWKHEELHRSDAPGNSTACTCCGKQKTYRLSLHALLQLGLTIMIEHRH